MAFHTTIDFYEESDRNRADVLNEPLEYLLQNDNYLNDLSAVIQSDLNSISNTLLSDYTKTEDLNTLLENGVKGDKGDTGVGLNYNWSGTSLGVKREDETDYTYVNLKGEAGSGGLERDEVTSMIEQAVDGIIVPSKVSQLENDSNFITTTDLPSKVSELENDSNFITIDDVPLSYKIYNSLSQIGLTSTATMAEIASSMPNYSMLCYTAYKSNQSELPATYGLLDIVKGSANYVSYMFRVSTGSTTADILYYAHYHAASGGWTGWKCPVTDLTSINNEISDLKTTSVNGKTTVANAINGVLDTSLSSTTSYEDMALYISILKATSNMFKNATSLTTNNPSVTDIRGYIYFGTDATYTFTASEAAVYDRFRFMKNSETSTSISILNLSQESLAQNGELGYTSNRYAQFDIVFFNEPISGTFTHTYDKSKSLIYTFK